MDLSRYFIDGDGELCCLQHGVVKFPSALLGEYVSAANRHEWEAHRTG